MEPELCIFCDEPMCVTGLNVTLGTTFVGTTWACKNEECREGYNPHAECIDKECSNES